MSNSNAKDFLSKLTEMHPFISILQHAGQDYVGIIQNKDDLVTSIYNYGAIIEPEIKAKFLEVKYGGGSRIVKYQLICF